MKKKTKCKKIPDFTNKEIRDVDIIRWFKELMVENRRYLLAAKMREFEKNTEYK